MTTLYFLARGSGLVDNTIKIQSGQAIPTGAANPFQLIFEPIESLYKQMFNIYLYNSFDFLILSFMQIYTFFLYVCILRDRPNIKKLCNSSYFQKHPKNLNFEHSVYFLWWSSDSNKCSDLPACCGLCQEFASRCHC